MSTFLGIGAGPIQTGIFVSGAARGGYERIVLADVDPDLIQAVRAAGSLTVNTACADAVKTDTYPNIEIYNPADAADLDILKQVAAEATAIATALPSTGFYNHVAPWLSAAFQSAPRKTRYVYTAENSTTAATELRDAVGAFPETFYLDTVIGKMSKIFTTSESELPPLAPGFSRGHLVEDFNVIYSSSAPGVDEMAPEGIYSKADLGPFEEAKLYGHNAVHFLLGSLAKRKGCRYLSDAAAYPELLRSAHLALRDECGAALCRKFAGVDEFFAMENFSAYAAALIDRMVSPILNDSVDRIIRHPERKFSWNDRIIGAIRLCLDQGVFPIGLSHGVTLPSGVEENWRRESAYNPWEATAVLAALKAGSHFDFALAPADHLRAHCGSPDQLARARMSTLTEGDGRGNRIIDVNNGSGLSFTVAPDRGMDIVEAAFQGMPLAFCAPAGHVNPNRASSRGMDWLRFWAGGLLTTCGLRHVGPPEDDTDNPLDSHRGLHGRLSAQSAEDVGISRQWRGNRYELALSGTMREAMMFNENLRLERKLSTALGDNTIYIEDRVRNLGCTAEYVQMLYHCNFGYPVVAPGTVLETVDHELKPRDAVSAVGLEQWQCMGDIRPGAVEQCFLHHIPPTADGWAEVKLISPEAGMRVTLAYDTSTLPNLMQWKLEDAGRYVLGLEPTNTTVSGRNADIAAGIAPELLPGESMTFRLRLSFSAI
jgi:hypothetical protein